MSVLGVAKPGILAVPLVRVVLTLYTGVLKVFSTPGTLNMLLSLSLASRDDFPTFLISLSIASWLNILDGICQS